MKQTIFLCLILVYTFRLTAQEQDTEAISQQYALGEIAIAGTVKFKKGDKIKLDNLNFKGGTADLLAGSEQILEKLLTIMRENPNLKIQVQGHICCITDAKTEVSEARARIVWLYLLLNEVENERVTYKDFGGTTPIFSIPEKSEFERRQNRRVEIEIIAN